MTDEQQDCPYCHNKYSRKYLLETDIDARTIVYINNAALLIESANSYGKIPINYCPMCGRDLIGGGNSE